MSIRKIAHPVDDLIRVENVLISVSDKQRLDVLVPELLKINPQANFYSTGGTATRLQEILGETNKDALIKVESYTALPEMEGGLVKTLHPLIHAGILGERNNPQHVDYLKTVSKRMHPFQFVGFPGIEKAEVGSAYGGTISIEGGNGVFFDMVIVNLYPFEETIKKNNNFEPARDNIDIGGPTMVRGAAKNFMGCAVVVDPTDYSEVITHMRENAGSTTFDHRFHLAQKAWEHTAAYDKGIAEYMRKVDPTKMRKEYTFKEAEKR